MIRTPKLEVAVALMAALLCLYAGHLQQAGYVYEDLTWQQMSQVRPSVLRPRGLTLAIWWLQQQVWSSPRLAHAINLVLHGLVVLSVYLLASRFVSRRWAWLAASVVALHPLAVESVAYAASRSELIAALGVVLMCWIAAGRWWRPHALVCGVMALLLGLAGKESAIVGLWLIPLVARQPPRWARFSRATAATVAVLGLGGMVAAAQVGEAPGVHIGWADWLALQATAATRLFALTIVPVGQTIDYDYDAIPQIWRLLSIGCVTVLAGLTFWLWSRRRLVAMGLAWMLLVVLPRLIVQTPRSYLNEHQWYLALVGWAFVVVGLVAPRTSWVRRG